MLLLVVTASREECYELNREEPEVVLSTKNHTGGLHGREDHLNRKNIFIQWLIKSYIFHLNPEVDALFQRVRFNPIKDEVWFEKKL